VLISKLVEIILDWFWLVQKGSTLVWNWFWLSVVNLVQDWFWLAPNTLD